MHGEKVVLRVVLLTFLLTPDAKIQPVFTGGKAVAFGFSHHGHSLVTLLVPFSCSDCSKFDR